MATFISSRTRLYYEQHGYGAPIVLLHGLTQTPEAMCSSEIRGREYGALRSLAGASSGKSSTPRNGLTKPNSLPLPATACRSEDGKGRVDGTSLAKEVITFLAPAKRETQILRT